MESFAEHISSMLDVCVYNPLSMKSFHAVWAGNVHEYSLKSNIGKICYIPFTPEAITCASTGSTA
jgi:hypothetical protein